MYQKRKGGEMRETNLKLTQKVHARLSIINTANI